MKLSLLRIAARIATTVPVPSAQQHTDFDCGPTCLQAALKYLGIEVDEGVLSRLAKTDPVTGADAYNIAAVAEAFGVSVELRYGMTISELANAMEAGKVCIIHIQAYAEEEDHDYSQDTELGHYVIPTAMQMGMVALMDPYLPPGQRAVLSVEDLLERWHGWELEADRAGIAVVISGAPKNPETGQKELVPLD